MPKLKDLTGLRFGRLTVIERAENSKQGQARWKCRCDCDNICIVNSRHLLGAVTKSCGCLSKETSTVLNTTHGMCYTSIFRTWSHMKSRCFNQRSSDYPNYGGRGITVYSAWIDNFPAFYDYVSTFEHFGEQGYTLDRIDNNGNYEPNNLRWASKKEQSRNRRNNIIVEYNGVKMLLIELSKITDIPYGTLLYRYHAGDRGERLFRPVKK